MDLDEADRRLRDIIATVQTEARQALLDVLPLIPDPPASPRERDAAGNLLRATSRLTQSIGD